MSDSIHALFIMMSRLQARSRLARLNFLQSIESIRCVVNPPKKYIADNNLAGRRGIFRNFRRTIPTTHHKVPISG